MTYFRRIRSRSPSLPGLSRRLPVLGLVVLGAAAVAPAPEEAPAALPIDPVHRSPVVAESCLADGRRQLAARWAEWRTLVTSGGNGGDEAARATRAEEIIRRSFALERMSAEIVGGRWGGMHELHKERFQAALARAIRLSLLPWSLDSGPLPALRPADEEWRRDGSSIRARYWLVRSDGQDWFTFRLHEGASGECRILDIRRDDRSLLKEFSGIAGKVFDDGLDFGYLVAVLGEYDHVIIEDFEDEAVGTIPVEWFWRDQDDDENKPYRVQEEGGNRYLEATDEGESVILGVDRSWNISEYPYIAFRVRVNRIPEGGNERDDDRVDSAAGIYLTLNKKVFGTIPESVKYVWSPTLPVGTAVRREGIGRPWQVVFGSGTEGLGEWRSYVFDLRQAYRDTFGGSPPKHTVGIGVLSDANSVGGSAWADYDDFRALRRAPPSTTSGVLEIVPPLDSNER